MKKKSILDGLLWKFSERILVQLVNIIVNVILARMLLPSDYGLLSLVMVFISIADIMVNYSFSNALIQKKDSDAIDFSSVFYFNIFFSLLIYFCLYLGAPVIADYFEHTELVSIVRILALRIIIVSLNSVQQAYVSKKMLFKKFFFSTLGGTVAAAFLGIYLAMNGFGVWALVGQYLINPIIDTMVLWFTVRWRPIPQFSFSRLKTLFGFGGKLLFSGILDRAYIELRSVIIGKKYSSIDLAYYKNGEQYPQILINNINVSISAVFFPALSKEQDNIDDVRKMLSTMVRMSAYIVFPCMVGMAVVAENVIEILLTEKWLECVPYLQIACFTYAFYPIHTANLDVLKALGKTDMMLKLEVLKKAIGIVLLICAVKYGVLAIALSAVVQTIIAFFVNTFSNKRILYYGWCQQVKDILPSIVNSFIMGVVVWGIGSRISNIYIGLLIQIVSGIVVYFILSIVTKQREFYILYHFIKEKFVHI